MTGRFKLAKKVLSVGVALTMAVTMLPVSAFPVLAVEEKAAEQTKLDISKGDITIAAESVSGYDAEGNEVTTVDADGYIITGTTTEYAVTVSGGEHNITLSNVNINRSESDGLAFSVAGKAEAYIELKGENTLKGGSNYAGLSVAGSAAVTIDGDGNLTAIGKDGGAGIGGNNAQVTGKITINSGSITAEGSEGSGVFANGEYNTKASGIGGNGNQDTGIITINGGTINAKGSSSEGSGAADIGSGYWYSEMNGNVSVSSVSVTVIINGGNIKGTVGVGSSDNGETATIQNAKGTDVSKREIVIRGAEDGMVIDGCEGVNPEEYEDGFGLNGVKTIGDELYLYLPEDTEITSLTSGNVTYAKVVANTYADSSSVVNAPELELQNGSVTFSMEEGAKYYQQGNEKKYYTGNVLINGASQETDNTITVADGTHNITLSNVNIDRSESNGSPLSVEGTAEACIELKGENTLKGGSNYAGLSVAGSAAVTIGGDGSLTAIGKDGGAGIGGNKSQETGKITINSGTITAEGSSFFKESEYGNLCDYAAGIGGSSSSKVGNITINGGTLNAKGSSKAADIGSGSYDSPMQPLSTNVTVIINGGNIKGTVGVGSDFGGETATIRNAKGTNVSKREIVILGAEDGTVIDGCEGVSSEEYEDGFGLNGVKTIGNELYLYLPEGADITSLTSGNVTYRKAYANMFIDDRMSFVNEPELELQNGSITFSIEDGIRYYQQGSEKKYYAGNAVINGASKETENTITVADGTHNIILSNVNIDRSDASGSPLSVEGTAEACIELKGDNTLKGGSNYAGLSVAGSASVTIAGDGSLTAIGKDGGAGIGGNKSQDTGKITINSGFITAEGNYFYDSSKDYGYYAAGIGGSSWREVGIITLNGGTVNAKGSNQAADIGSGSYYSPGEQSSTNVTVIINGGNIKGTVGVGSSDNEETATIQNASQQEVSPVTLTMDSLSEDMKVTKADGIGDYGLQGVKTIEKKLYLYLPAGTNPTMVAGDKGIYTGTVTGSKGTFRKHTCTKDDISYRVDKENASVYAVCKEYNADADYVKLYTPNANANGDIIYDGEEKQAYWKYNETEEENIWAGVTISDITYTKKGTETEAFPINPGEYTASSTVKYGDETATVSVEFTIGKSTPSIGKVTANTLFNTTDITKVSLCRESEAVAGTIELKETELQYGTNTYHWIFTPTDEECYTTEEGTVDITVIGVKYRFDDEEAKNFENISDIGMYCKDKETLVLDYVNTENNIDSVQYSISDKVVQDTTSLSWKEYQTKITLDKPGTYYVYVKVTAKDGNETLMHTQGMLVYTDSTTETTELTYTEKEGKDKTVAIELNNNTIKEVKVGDTALTPDTDYVISEAGVLTLKTSYLDTLSASETAYTLTVSYLAFDTEGKEVSADTVISLKVSKKEIPTPTKEVSVSNTPTPSETVIVSNTPVPTEEVSVTSTPVPSNAVSVSNTPAPTKTESVSNTPAPTKTESVSNTPTPSETVSVSNTPTPSETVSVSSTPTPTDTVSGIPTPEITKKVTPVPSLVPPKKGTVIKDEKNKAKYKVTVSDIKNGTVEYVGSTNSKATKVTVPKTVTIDGITYKVVSVGKNAFKNNKILTKVTVGSNVSTIGANAFYGCTKLKTVSIGKNVTAIGDKAFYKCTALTKITIPAKVKKIGKQAFYGCKKLKTVTIKTTKLTNKNVGSKAFAGIYKKATMKVPKSKVASYKKLLKNKGAGSQVKIKK